MAFIGADHPAQLLSDAPAHQLFVLLGPAQQPKAGQKLKDALPDVLCVIQV